MSKDAVCRMGLCSSIVACFILASFLALDLTAQGAKSLAADSSDSDGTAFNTELYESISARLMADETDLIDEMFLDYLDTYLLIPPHPDCSVTFDMGTIPYDAATFPTARLLMELTPDTTAAGSKGPSTYQVLLWLDPLTWEIVVLDVATLREAARFQPPFGFHPADLIAEAWGPAIFRDADLDWVLAAYSPSRHLMQYRLVDERDLVGLVWSMSTAESEPTYAPMRLVSSNDFAFTGMTRLTGALQLTIRPPEDWPGGEVDIFRIADLMSPWWTLAGTTNVSTGTTSFVWLDTTVSGVSHLRFYRAGDGETDTDLDGVPDARELLLYGTDPDDDASFPVTLSGEVLHTNTPQSGAIVIVAVTDPDSWDTTRSTDIAAPGVFALEGVPNLRDTWVKAWRDWHPNGLPDPWEATGTITNAPLYLTTSVSNLVIELEDPPTSISGTVSYAGRQSGPIRVAVVTASNAWDLTHSATLSAPGFFHVPDLDQTSYWVKAWIDADQDEAFDSEREAHGAWTSNPIFLSNSVWGVDFALTDVDADSDGLPDWWEFANFGDLSEGAEDDFDSDGLPNAWEYLWQFDPTDPNDAMEDADADGYPNVYEYMHGTDPRKTTGAPDEGGLDPVPTPTIIVTTNGAHTIQSALDAATNAYDMVLVKAGVYDITNDIDFHAGRIVLLLAESGAQATILDGGDSVRLIDFPSGVGPHTALTGFRVRNGRAGEGGGIRVQDASPLISHCIVTDCIATEDGGGLVVSGGAPRIVNCTFSDNSADDDGGGVRCKAQSAPVFVDCVVSNNTAKHGGGMHWTSSTGTVVNCVVSDNVADKDGGGAYCREASPQFSACVFTRNLAKDDGGGIRCTNASPSFVTCVIAVNTAHDHGGGFYGNDSGALFDGCLISGNTAVDGGGVGCNGSTIELRGCALLDNWAHTDGGGLRAKDSQPRVRNSLFARNRAFGDGGGVHLKGPTAVLALENCTVMDNRTRLAGGGMAAGDDATASATNSIFWGNVPDQLDGISGLAYSCVEGGAAGTGILTNHPGLTAVYYRLLPESPCIDAGTNAAWMTEALDLHGQARIDDDTVDIGADEWHGSGAGGDVPGVGTPGGVWPLPPAPDPDRLRLEFSVGDPSNSGSEKYRIVFSNEAETIIFDNTAFGVVHVYSNDFLKGTSYTVRVEHVATTGTSACGANPDYDYRAWIAELPDSTNGTHEAWFSGPGFAVHDPDRILGTHWTSGCTSTFAASNKTATLHVLKVELSDFDPMAEKESNGTTAEEKEVTVTVEPATSYASVASLLSFVLENEKGLTGAAKDVAELTDATVTATDNKIKIKAKGYGEAEVVVKLSGAECKREHFVVLEGRRPTAAEKAWVADWPPSGSPDCDALVDGHWSVLQGFGNPGYNCVAWSAGITTSWINPFATQAEWDSFYAGTSGYGALPAWPGGLNTKGAVAGGMPPDGSCTVVLKSGGTYTHAYRKWGLGYYSSKIGQGILIVHKPEEMNCTAYGTAVHWYKP